MALMFTIGGVMRGAGDTAANMWITLGSLWLVRVPLAWYFSSGLGLGIRGVWWAMLASPIAGSLLNYLYYRTGRWKRHVVVRRQPAGAAEAGSCRPAERRPKACGAGPRVSRGSIGRLSDYDKGKQEKCHSAR